MSTAVPRFPSVTVEKPDWGHIDTVLLDMDGTLLDLAFDNHFWLEIVPAAYAAARMTTVDSRPHRARSRSSAPAKARYPGTASTTGAASSTSTSRR